MPTEESLKRYKRAYGAQKVAQQPEDPERKMRRLEAEAADLRGKLKRETARADDAENLRDTVFGISLKDLGPPAWPAPRRIKGKSRHKPILFTSDFQYGETVSPAEMDGMNEFNKNIFLDRYQLMIRKTIQWCDAIGDGWGAVYPEGIIYLRGGDAISGDIHEELRESNDAGPAMSIVELAEIEAEGIRRLRDRFGHVHVISIPGNHGRTKFKPQHKGYVANNWETVLAYMIQAKLERDPTVTFECPESGFAYFKAEGWRFALRHGDRMGAGGGVGFIGAPAPITKGHLRTRINEALSGEPVDFVLTGHLHTSMKLPRGFANGCMPGYNEFARGLNLDPDCAKQWLLLAHTERVYGLELELSPFPRRRA